MSNLDSRKDDRPAIGDEKQDESIQIGTLSPTILDVPLESLPTIAIAGTYQMADFSDFLAIISAERFYQEGYDSTLADLIAHVIERESPILEELLVHRIARAHGFQKSGRLIRERVLDLTERNYHLGEDPLGGRFAWLNADQVSGWNRYRIPHSEEHVRKVEEISFQELRAASLAAAGSDVPVEIGRLFGNRRLSAANRQRLQAMIDLQSER